MRRNEFEFWLILGLVTAALLTPAGVITIYVSGIAAGLALRQLRLDGARMEMVVGLGALGVALVAVAAR